LRFVGAWRNTNLLDGVTSRDLALRDGCSITLRRVAQNSFEGSTAGTGCESTLRGASYATSEVTVTPTELVSWDRGFDRSGVQVWGATVGGYRFDNVAEE
jgi:hypothetical protein